MSIFATNTSGISINSIGSELKHPERFIGTHFFMPADVIPLVEIIKGKKTKDDSCRKNNAILSKVRQVSSAS